MRCPDVTVLEWIMAESVPVRCPVCRREHLYAAPSYPCVCGAPLAPALNHLAAPVVVTHRTWDEDWVTVRCGDCGREDQWPYPELGCPCGAVLRIPVTGALRPLSAESPEDSEATEAVEDIEIVEDVEILDAADVADAGEVTETIDFADVGEVMETIDVVEVVEALEPGDELDRHRGHRPGDPARHTHRAAFRPVTIRSARDAVTAAALYLRWLGYRDIRRADQRPPNGIGLAARGILAQVDPTVRPASLRDVECLWLTAMTESASCVYFSLAGYAEDARAVADSLGVPLFILDLTGTPQPLNSPADELVAAGA